MKQTAVEYLIQEIKNAYVHSKSTIEWNDIFQKAKAMEKQEIIDAWNDGNYSYFYSKETGENFDDGEEYYNELYNKQDVK